MRMRYIVGAAVIVLCLGIFLIFISANPPEPKKIDFELFNAILRRDSKAVEESISNGANVNVSKKFADHSYISSQPLFIDLGPLHVASSIGDGNIVEILLANGAGIDRKDSLGRTALYWAASGGYASSSGAYPWLFPRVIGTAALITVNPEESANHVDVTRLLLEHGASTDVADNSGVTALHFASICGQTKIANLLISKGASINAKTKLNATPLHWAASGGHKNVIEVLIANKADINAVTTLSKHGQQYDCGHTALYYALDKKYDEVVSELRQHGAKLSDEEQSKVNRFLCIAAASGNMEMASEMIYKGANPSGESLCLAAENDNVEIAQLLIDAGADVDIQGPAKERWGPLHNAAYYGSAKVAKLLINNGANINAAEDRGLVPLWLAASNNRVEVVKLLVENGAITDVKNNEGKSLIEEIRRYSGKEKEEILKLLSKANNTK